METTTYNYVTVMPSSGNRSGWMVASRTGNLIDHTRLVGPSIHDPEAARAEAAKLFPGKVVYMAGDPVKPWDKVSA